MALTGHMGHQLWPDMRFSKPVPGRSRLCYEWQNGGFYQKHVVGLAPERHPLGHAEFVDQRMFTVPLKQHNNSSYARSKVVISEHASRINSAEPKPTQYNYQVY
jgi:hypothetical protein